MKTTNIESFGRTVNDCDNRLPKGRGRCFDTGMWGGCGATCGAFVDGECEEPQEISKQEVIDAQGEDDAQIIFKKYECLKNLNHEMNDRLNKGT